MTKMRDGQDWAEPVETSHVGHVAAIPLAEHLGVLQPEVGRTEERVDKRRQWSQFSDIYQNVTIRSVVPRDRLNHDGDCSGHLRIAACRLWRRRLVDLELSDIGLG